MEFILISKTQLPDWRGHLNTVGADGKSLYHGWGVLREFTNYVLIKADNAALINWGRNNPLIAEITPKLFRSSGTLPPRIASLIGTVPSGSTVGDALTNLVGAELLE